MFSHTFGHVDKLRLKWGYIRKSGTCDVSTLCEPMGNILQANHLHVTNTDIKKLHQERLGIKFELRTSLLCADH